MVPRKAFWLLLVATSLTLAGCATPAPGGGSGAGDGNDTTDGTGSGSGDGSGSSGGDEAQRWYAFAFDRTITPKSGGSGKIQSFSFRNTQTSNDGDTIVDVDVEVTGTSTEDVRVTKMEMSGEFSQTTQSTPVRVHKLVHTLTVVQDDSGEKQPGDTGTVEVWVPADELPETSTFLWYFTKMAWTDPSGETGSWEYFVTPEMSAEAESGEAFYLPYSTGSGETGDWWGYDFMATTYGLHIFAGYIEGDQEFEEGSFQWGGYKHDVSRKTFTVGGYSFDGWSVEMTAGDASGTAMWRLDTSADFPMPLAYRWGGTSSDGSGGSNTDVYAMEITDLKLG